MIDQFDFVSNGGTRIQFNTAMIPLNRVDFEPDVRGETRNKMQRNGTWRGYTYVGKCLVHMEGQVFGTSSADFFTRKLGIVSTIYPDPTTAQTIRKLGQLEIKLTGMTEVAKGECSIDGPITCPMEGLSPWRAPLSITWVVFDGYFTGMTSGNFYYLQ